MTQQLDPMRFPLQGRALIEASAGTGKTYTITGLVLRLLLGHGDRDTAFVRPLTVEQILVVTFTEAATEELKSRIRSRIQQARMAFLLGESDDPLLKQLLEECPDHSLQAQRLLLAEQSMDQAAIFTIHGFCSRMLGQFAIESGSPWIRDSPMMNSRSCLRRLQITGVTAVIRWRRCWPGRY
ncbi:UvrD-helicase domain-containing protein [Dongshaea marina]|uniref:UvrD-helicase domain-containing protein n=1 Tax=Dongshaea marina TaxID=2047966 RepID=UPI000D3E23B8|nr:UvrD-helicase domain-containing protein [Dongshaea marina]